jgi:hypothetical protein
MYVASVSHGYCKSRSRYCICYNGYTHMLQASVLNFSFVIRRMLKGVYLDVAYVGSALFGCCTSLQQFSSVIRRFASVSNVCCKCLSCFRRILQVLYRDSVYVLQ